VCVSVGHTDESCKTDEPMEIPFGGGRLVWVQRTIIGGCTLEPSGKYHGMICAAAAAMRAVATIPVAICYYCYY